MSFLAPLYALGALAVALPIVFHFLQRRPKGTMPFSSLMFLKPSPPRFTRRSRLNNIVLLLLRAAALILLAIAFARPFLRSLQQLTSVTPQRRVAILIDRSASMRREDLWDQAIEQASDVLDGLDEKDEVILAAFDHGLEFLVSEAQGGDAGSMIQRSREALKELTPSWGGSRLGEALVSVVDFLQSQAEDESTNTQIVLISDLQEGVELQELQAFAWPADFLIDIKPLTVRQPGNASLNWVIGGESLAPTQVMVRISATKDMTANQFKLSWRLQDGSLRQAKSVQVPPAESRTVAIDRPDDSIELVLEGDAQPFDNSLFIVDSERIQQEVLYVGDSEESRGGVLFFLQRAPLSQGRIDVIVRTVDENSFPNDVDARKTPLIVLNGPPVEAAVESIRSYLLSGGRVLVVLDPSELGWSEHDIPLPSLATLCDVNSITVSTTPAGTDALLAYIDFQHDLFAPFAEPQFSDFSNIRFWSHFKLAADSEQPWTILARFEDQSPALVERTFDSGRLWIMPSGWNLATSQLGRSTKFLPLLCQMLGSAQAETNPLAFATVGDRLPWQRIEQPVAIVMPDQSRRDISEVDDSWDVASEIGVYRLETDSVADQVAVNLDPRESRTSTMDVSQLEQFGLQQHDFATDAELVAHDRQMRDVELESRQQLWRWLLVAALCVLAVETYIAGRYTRSQYGHSEDHSHEGA